MKKGILAVFFIVLAISFIAYSAEEKKAMAKPKGKMMSKSRIDGRLLQGS